MQHKSMYSAKQKDMFENVKGCILHHKRHDFKLAKGNIYNLKGMKGSRTVVKPDIFQISQ